MKGQNIDWPGIWKFKIQFFTGGLSQHDDNKYKWSVKISTCIATIYLKELPIRKGLATFW
jgi:hypothetical protein